MALYRKKPVVINAYDYPNTDEALENLTTLGCVWSLFPMPSVSEFRLQIWNDKEHQYIGVPVGHKIIKGIGDEWYPCDPDIFEATYEPAEAAEPARVGAWRPNGCST
jgi:hypothetical protein